MIESILGNRRIDAQVRAAAETALPRLLEKSAPAGGAHARARSVPR